MTDRITANLPARDMAETVAFYATLGFEPAYFSADWSILRLGGLELEFFHHPGIDPRSSWFSACIRVDDPDALLADWRRAGLPDDATAIPRLTGFVRPGGAPRMAALVDPNGSLLRVIDNRDAGP